MPPPNFSLRALTDILAKLDKTLEVSLLPATQWISPYYEVANRNHQIYSNTVSYIQVFNPSTSPVDVQMLFTRWDGTPLDGMTKTEKLAPSGMMYYGVGDDTSTAESYLSMGSVRIVASAPVLPAGNISMDRTHAVNVIGVYAPPTTVSFAMHFYPVHEKA